MIKKRLYRISSHSSNSSNSSNSISNSISNSSSNSSSNRSVMKKEEGGEIEVLSNSWK